MHANPMDMRLAAVRALRACTVALVSECNPTGLLEYMATESSVAMDLMVQVLFESMGVANQRGYFSSREWASLILQGLGSMQTMSDIDVRAGMRPSSHTIHGAVPL